MKGRFLVLCIACLSVTVRSMPDVRPASTTIDALRRFSGYFHLQNVVLRGELVESGRRVSLRGGDTEMQVVLNDVNPMEGPVEVRGQLIDIGRLTAADPRLSRYENKPDPEHWPMPGEELVLSVTSVAKATPDGTATIRSIALEPWKYKKGRR